MDPSRGPNELRAAVLVRVGTDQFAFWAMREGGQTYGSCQVQLVEADQITADGWEVELWVVVQSQRPIRSPLEFVLPPMAEDDGRGPGPLQ